MKIEKVKIEELRPYERNAKIHTPDQIEQIKKSILEFGFNDPIGIDENNMVIEGHGRLTALLALGYKEVECIRLTGLTDEQKRAYILVHNKLTMNTGFDLGILAEELEKIKGVDMTEFDFDVDVTVDTDMTFEEDAEQTPMATVREPRCAYGQLWQLGRHRLLCGDSTDAKDVDRLIGDERMDLCITDPPYNVDYVGKTVDALTMQNDHMEDGVFFGFLCDFYKQMLRTLKPGGSYYIFHADSEGLNFRAALREAGGQVKQNLVWVKNSMVLGRQDYQWKHEPCLYGWKDGASHYFTPDRCQTTVFDTLPDLETLNHKELLHYANFLLYQLKALNTSVIREDRPAVNDLHPTMKPIPLLVRLVANSSRRGENVVDFFGGSGSTLMACEETGRVCYTMEIDPHYADVIISRWEEATGGKAVLING